MSMAFIKRADFSGSREGNHPPVRILGGLYPAAPATRPDNKSKKAKTPQLKGDKAPTGCARRFVEFSLFYNKFLCLGSLSGFVLFSPKWRQNPIKLAFLRNILILLTIFAFSGKVGGPPL